MYLYILLINVINAYIKYADIHFLCQIINKGITNVILYRLVILLFIFVLFLCHSQWHMFQ